MPTTVMRKAGRRAVLSFGLIIVAGVCGGCGDGAESIEEQRAFLVTGNWSGVLVNGDTGPNPFISAGSTAPVSCEVYSTGDNWWHPGKLWNGTCRISWGPGVHFSSSYRTLQNPASGNSYQFIDYVGFTPPNAVVSTAGALPVCRISSQEFGFALGKLWEGRCRFEYGNEAWSSSAFKVLIQP